MSDFFRFGAGVLSSMLLTAALNVLDIGCVSNGVVCVCGIYQISIFIFEGGKNMLVSMKCDKEGCCGEVNWTSRGDGV